MSRDYLHLGSTPADEDCAQVGRDDYRQRAMAELNTWRKQLHREFPEIQNSGLVSLVIKAESHDFGTYHELAVRFDDAEETAIDLALRIEAECAGRWDDESLAELAALGFPVKQAA